MLGIIFLRSPGEREDRNCHQYWLLMDFNLVAGSLGAIIAQYVIVGTGRNFFGAVGDFLASRLSVHFDFKI